MGLQSRYGVTFPGGPRWYTLRTLGQNEDTLIDALPYQLVSYTPIISAGSICTLPNGEAKNDGKYVGVQINRGGTGVAAGATVTVTLNDGVTVVDTLYVEGQTVWYGYIHAAGAWQILAREDPDPGTAIRFAPFAAYDVTGTDADLTDLSGNGRTLTKLSTVQSANGLRPGYSGAVLAAGQGWSRTDANFRLTSAMSIELVIKPAGNFITGAGGFFLTMGTGTGGGVNNRVFSMGVSALTAATTLLRTGFRWTSQHGANVDDTFLARSAANASWTHVLFTRSIAGGGVQVMNAYINGVLTATGNLTEPDTSTTTAFSLGNFGGGGDLRFVSIWDSLISTLQATYLARYRLGRIWRT